MNAYKSMAFSHAGIRPNAASHMRQVTIMNANRPEAMAAKNKVDLDERNLGPKKGLKNNIYAGIVGATLAFSLNT